jgi:hypothetical protein
VAKIVIDDQTPELPDDEVGRYRDFSRIQSRFRQVSHGIRKKRLNKVRNRYWFLGVLVVLLMLILMLT